MKPRLLADYIPQYIEIARKRLSHQQEPELPAMPPIHEDLGGLSAAEIGQEISAVERRLELGVVQPEGKDGLNYRLTRLQAQLKALQRKDKIL